MHPFIRTAVAVSLALTGLQGSAEAQDSRKSDRNQLTSEEIRARPVGTVYDLIRSRRSHWLSTRGSATLRTRSAADPYGGPPVAVAVEPVIIVYVDNVRQGTHELLRSISTEDVESIERLDSMSATQRFGTGHEHGAILIRRRAR